MVSPKLTALLFSTLTKERDQLITERDALIHERDSLINERNALIHERNALIIERDQAIISHAETSAQASSKRRSAGIENSESQNQQNNTVTPAVFLITQPKSGSVYIGRKLSALLEKEEVEISPGYFPEDTIDFRRFEMFLQNNSLSQSHINSSRFNVLLMRNSDKNIVHFRDPRQSTLSWLHHLDRLRSEGQENFLAASHPYLPEDFFDSSFENKLDYLIDNYLPCVVTWQLQWLEAIDQISDNKRFLVTTYEDFLEDNELFFLKLVRFITDDDNISIKYQELEPDKSLNFRLGQRHEWKNVYSAEQKGRSEELIPGSLIEKLQWDVTAN